MLFIECLEINLSNTDCMVAVTQTEHTGSSPTMMRCMKAAEGSSLSYQDIAAQLGTDLQIGLSDSEARRRRKNHGYNEFEITDDEPLWKKYLGQVSGASLILIG